MSTKLLLISILLTSLYASAEKLSFTNYTLYKILPENVQQITLLQQLEGDANYDFWTDPVPSAKFVNIMSTPQQKSNLESFLNRNEIKFEVAIENVQDAMNKETVTPYNRIGINDMQWDRYYTLEDVEAWMTDVVTAYPSIVTPVVGGVTSEGREIKGLKITHGGEKRVIFIEAGIHSREWIVVSFACYLINELVTSTDSETMAAARDFEWYIFPVTNPDGYEWTHSTNRMWRKNRRPIIRSLVPLEFDYGVDLNRNWNNNWLAKGASTTSSSDTYAGPGPFSEPETRSLSRFIRSIGDKIDIYLSFHSFSQYLLIPFGNSTGHYYANYDEAVQVGRRAMGALASRFGTDYETGTIADVIYEATGGSVDWVKEQLKVPLVYCYELRDRGNNGFLLPTDQILPNNEEAMESVIEIIHQAKRLGVI